MSAAMTKTDHRLTVMCLSVLSLVPAIGGVAEDSNSEAFIAWAQQHAVPITTVEPGQPFDDLQPLRGILSNARVVCLGESRHDAHEHFLFKHRVIEFLVKEMGFTGVAMEESLPCAEGINEYVLSGKGDPDTLLNNMGAWFIWDTEEVLAMIKWMRTHNADPAHQKKVRFYGIDITDPLPGVARILNYLDTVEPGYSGRFRSEPDPVALLSESNWPETMENYKRLSSKELDTLSTRYTDMLTRLGQRGSESATVKPVTTDDWMLREAVVAVEANKLFTAGVNRTFAEAGDVREKAMADNTRWIMERAASGEHLVVWAHNFHVAKAPADLDIPGRAPARGMKSMITYLNEELGDNLVSIGFSFDRGDYPDGPLPTAETETVDGVLSRVGLPRFIIDLRNAPKAWVGRKVRMRGQGGFTDLVPADAFDALFFVDRITPTKPTSGARRRFGALGK